MNLSSLTPEERLIVAADFSIPLPLVARKRVDWMYERILRFVDLVALTGICIKVEAILAEHPEILDAIHGSGLRSFADGKFSGIPQAMRERAQYLESYNPHFVTVMAHSGTEALEAFTEVLPETNVLAVTVPTSQDEATVRRIYDTGTTSAVSRLAHIALSSKLPLGVVCSGFEAEQLRNTYMVFGREFIIAAANVRMGDVLVHRDDQNPKRATSITQAIRRGGASHIIMGRPITQSEKPLEMIKRALDEIHTATSKRPAAPDYIPIEL